MPKPIEQQAAGLASEIGGDFAVAQKIARSTMTRTAIARQKMPTWIRNRNMSRSERSGFHATG